ncbi:hypothetical protein PUN28_019548 [Cardiocondyla obscurior]
MEVNENNNQQHRTIANYPNTNTSYPTFPVYESNEKKESVYSSNNAESPASAKETSNNSESTTVPTEISESFFSKLKPYDIARSLITYSTQGGNYLLQVLGVAFLSTSFIRLICSYTSICEFLQPDEAKVARSHVSQEHLRDITWMLDKALEKFSAENMQ